MNKRLKKRNKKINANRPLVSADYRSLRALDNNNLFLMSLRQSIKSPYFRQNFLPSKKRFQHSLVDEKMYFFEDSFENDLHWSGEVITHMAEHLSNFISIRNQVENKILEGEYSVALDLVETIKESFGFSYWYLENKFSLLSRLGREDEIYVYLRSLKEGFSEYEGREATLLMEKSLFKKSTSRFEFMIQSILDSVEKDSIDFDSISFLFKFDVNQSYNFGYILRFMLHLNIVDIYNCFIRATSYAIVNDCVFSSTCSDYLQNIRSILKDPKVDNILSYITHEYDKYSDYHEICENYISGNFRSVVTTFENMTHPLAFKVVFIELYVKSLIYLKEEPKIFFAGVFNELVDFAYKVTLSLDEISIRILDRVICQFTQSDFTYALHILKTKITSSSKEVVDKEYRLVDILINANNPFRPGIKVDGSICSGYSEKNIDSLQDKVPQFRFEKWKGDELFDNGDYSNSLKLYSKISNVPNYLELEIIEKKILIHYELGSVNAVVKTIVDLFLFRNITLKRLPLFDIKEKVLTSENLDRKSINTPIFAHVLKIMGLCNDQKVALLCDDYLYLNSFKTAREISDVDEKVVFLFSSTMTIEVLNRQDLKNTSLDDFINRALLLIKIQEKAENFESLSYEIEYLISQYSRKLFKNELGKGKISINIDAIKLLAKSNFSDEFDDLLQEDLNLADIDNKEFSKGYLKAEEFTLKVRDLYATHEVYGLDNTLNTDIRHNGIVPTLRVVFEANEVICTQQGDSYLDNLYYEQNCKNNLRYHGYRLFQNKIVEFSEQIDTLLNGLKNKYLHVFTNDLDDKEKLFKLTINNDEVAEVLTFVNSTHDLGLAIDCILELLNKKTSLAMKEGSATLKVYIKDRVDIFILDLIKSLEREAKINSSFIESLKHAKNQFAHVIFEVADWLNFIKKSADDFSLIIPIEEALEFVKETHPRMDISIEYDNRKALGEYDYSGEYLATFIRMFLILFQNAAKSITQNTRCNLKVGYVVNNGKAKITIHNNYDTINVELIDKIKESLSKDKILEGASKGTGSGIFKVKKMLSYELKISNSLDIFVDEKSKVFKLTITYDLARIRKEEESVDEISNN
jgi:hypothetical protein